MLDLDMYGGWIKKATFLKENISFESCVLPAKEATVKNGISKNGVDAVKHKLFTFGMVGDRNIGSGKYRESLRALLKTLFRAH